MVDALIAGAAAGALAFLFRPSLRRSDAWRATVTPLASIIGSGFLVVAPPSRLLYAVLVLIVIATAVFGIPAEQQG